MTDEPICIQCNPEGDGFRPIHFCDACLGRYGEALLKSTADPFDYALELRNGMEIRYAQATIRGDWVHLELEDYFREQNSSLPHRFARGIDVRIDQIVWCADAPDGS